MMRTFFTNIPASQIRPVRQSYSPAVEAGVDDGGPHPQHHLHQQEQLRMMKKQQQEEETAPLPTACHSPTNGSTSTYATASAPTSGGPLPPIVLPGRAVTASPTRFSFSPQRMKLRLKQSSSNNGKQQQRSGSFLKDFDWHKDIHYASHSQNWDRLLGNLKLCSSRLAAKRIETNKRNESRDIADLGLLVQDELGRTPLHAALACRDKNTRLPLCPPACILYFMQLDSMACRIRNDKGRLPLHVAVLYNHSIEVIAHLVETYPHAIAACDCKGETPLSYAIHMALKKSTRTLRNAPKSYWMPPKPITYTPATSSLHQEYKIAEDDMEAIYLLQWQDEQTDRWATVHWLLKSCMTATATTATVLDNRNSQEPEFDLSSVVRSLITGRGGGGRENNGGKTDIHNNNNHNKANSKPLLVEALLHAAPPDLIQLLIFMSSDVLQVISRTNTNAIDDGDNNTQQETTTILRKASAIAGSTIYSCIARHYPLGVLQSLALSCPSDVRNVRDETGMGLVSAIFVSGIFVQDNNIQGTDEWTLNPQLLVCIQEYIATGAILDYNNIAFIDWWQKIEFLICFCCDDKEFISCYNNNRHHQQGYEEGQQPDVLVQVPSQYLLHCSLRNPDIPPLVLRLLCSLYYESITVPDPVKHNLTIHLAAQTQEYIPRNYELQIMSGETNACGILLEYCPELAFCRDRQNRLPIHVAIGAGKTYKSLEVFLMNYEEDDSSTAGEDDENCMLNNSKSVLGGSDPMSLLEQRDPLSGLYPFQQAASYTIQTALDGYRWSCVARNKYSHAVWFGLSDRQKASAILKVAEFESLSRLTTVYQLLRNRPGVIRPSRNRDNIFSFRNECGMGLVASHFLSYCYTSPTTSSNSVSNNGTSTWVKHQQQYGIFNSTLNAAKESGLLLKNAPVTLLKWWQKMKFWIRSCEPPSNSPICKWVRAFLPKKDPEEKFLLHAALLNSDTPPQIIELILALHPDAARRSIAKTLPLHIASSTLSYTPRYFEQQQPSTIQLVLNSYPEAAKCRVLVDNSTLDNAIGSLPLHLSLRSGKTWDELKPLVEADPCSLKARDPDTMLYPFMMLALTMPSTLSTEQQLHFQYIARNQFTENEWHHKTPRQRYHAFRQVRKGYRLERLTTVFELLRRDVSAIENIQQKEPAVPTATATFASSDAPNQITLSDGGTRGEIKDGSESPEEESEPATSEAEEDPEEAAGSGHGSSAERDYESSNCSPTRNKAPKSSLTLSNFFAREEERSLQDSEKFREEEEEEQEREDLLGRDVFECEASVLSSLDVMSLVSGAASKTLQRRVGARRGVANKRQNEEEERSINITDLFGNKDNTNDDDKSSSDESAAETSEGANSDATEHHPSASRRHGSSHHHGSGFLSYNEFEDDESEESDDGLVYFQMRRRHKRNQLNFGGARKPDQMKNVRISKAPDERKSLARTGSIPADRGPIRKDSLRAMLMTCNADSYHSLTHEELGKLHSSSDMPWMSNKNYESGLLGRQSLHDSSEDDLLASYGSMQMAASSGGMKNRFDSSMESSMDSSATLKASKLSLEISGSIDSSINSTARLKASKSSLLSGSGSSASDASTNIDLLESEVSLNTKSYYAGDNTNSSSTFARDGASSFATNSYSTFAHEDSGISNTTFTNSGISNTSFTHSGTSNTSSSSSAQDHGRCADMRWVNKNKYTKSGLGSSLHDGSSDESEPDILNDASIKTSQRMTRHGSAASSKVPISGEYLSALKHSTSSRRSSTESTRSNRPYDKGAAVTGAQTPPLLSTMPEEITASHLPDRGTQGGSTEFELIRSLNVPILDHLTVKDSATFESVLLFGTKGTVTMEGGNSEKKASDEENSEGQTPSIKSLLSIQSETYFDKTEMRWKKRAVASRDEENAAKTGLPTPTSYELDTEPRASSVSTKTLANKLLSPPSSPTSPARTPTTDGHGAEISNNAIANASTKTLANKLTSPSKSSLKTTVSNGVPKPKIQSEVMADRKETESVSTKTLANKLISPPSSPLMTCQSSVSTDNYTSSKAEPSDEGTFAAPTSTPADLLLPSPLKRIHELRQMSQYESPKESLKKLPPSKFGVPFADQQASSREKTKRKNKAFAHAFGKPTKTRGRSPSPKRQIKVESSPPATSQPSSDCPKDIRPKHLRCLLCDKNSREVLLVPCRHLSMCRHCSAKMSDDCPTCPPCKKAVKDRVLVF